MLQVFLRQNCLNLFMAHVSFLLLDRLWIRSFLSGSGPLRICNTGFIVGWTLIFPRRVEVICAVHEYYYTILHNEPCPFWFITKNPDTWVVWCAIQAVSQPNLGHIRLIFWDCRNSFLIRDRCWGGGGGVGGEGWGGGEGETVVFIGGTQLLFGFYFFYKRVFCSFSYVSQITHNETYESPFFIWHLVLVVSSLDSWGRLVPCLNLASHALNL